MDWALVSIVILTIVLFFVALYSDFRKKKLLHLERMTALEKGLQPTWAYEHPPLTGRDYLRRGLLLLLPGIGLATLLWLTSSDFGSMWGGAAILMSGIGLAYLIYYLAEGRKQGVATLLISIAIHCCPKKSVLKGSVIQSHL